MPHRRLLMSATALTVAAAAAAAIAPTTAQAAPEPTTGAAGFALLEPTGPREVGTTELHLIDEDRADLWFPEQDRQLMVTMWYPTRDDGELAPYMTGAESAVFVDQLGIDAPEDYFSSVETNAVTGAEPVRGKLPLVVLSPGWSFPRATLTGLAEELASHGYAVAAVGHNFEAPMSLPDGPTNPCLACPTRPEGSTVTENRAADLTFVIDELTGPGSEWRPRLDRDAIAVGGHSMGGSAAHATAQTDERVRAAFNLDGTMHDSADAPVDIPFLLLGNELNALPGKDKTWVPAWDQMNDWKRWIRVEQTTHSSFTDLASFADDLGIPIQDMPGERTLELTRAYVLAFLDAQLECADAPILDGPSAEWPEAVFHNL